MMKLWVNDENDEVVKVGGSGLPACPPPSSSWAGQIIGWCGQGQGTGS